MKPNREDIEGAKNALQLVFNEIKFQGLGTIKHEKIIKAGETIRKTLEAALDDGCEIEGFGELKLRLENLTKSYISQFGEALISTELFHNANGKIEIQILITPQPPKSEG